MLKKKDYVSVSEGVQKQKLCNLQSLCDLKHFYTAFKEKDPNVNIGSESSVPRDPNGVFLLAQK